MSEISKQLREDITNTLKLKQVEMTVTLRSILSEAQSIALNDKRKDIIDADVISSALKNKKIANEMIEQYKNLEGRIASDNYMRGYRLNEACDKYLPTQMSADEVEAAVAVALNESGATSAKDMGKVMKAFNNKNEKGTFNGKLVSSLIKDALSKLAPVTVEKPKTKAKTKAKPKKD